MMLTVYCLLFREKMSHKKSKEVSITAKTKANNNAWENFFIIPGKILFILRRSFIQALVLAGCVMKTCPFASDQAWTRLWEAGL